MKNTTIRVSDRLLDDIKILKKDMQVSTYEKVLEILVKEELMKRYAITYEGHVAEGAVVSIEGRIVVIEKVTKNIVSFSDGTYVFNDSIACKTIKVLSNTIEEFAGVVK